VALSFLARDAPEMWPLLIMVQTDLLASDPRWEFRFDFWSSFHSVILSSLVTLFPPPRFVGLRVLGYPFGPPRIGGFCPIYRNGFFYALICALVRSTCHSLNLNVRSAVDGTMPRTLSVQVTPQSCTIVVLNGLSQRWAFEIRSFSIDASRSRNL